MLVVKTNIKKSKLIERYDITFIFMCLKCEKTVKENSIKRLPLASNYNLAHFFLTGRFWKFDV